VLFLENVLANRSKDVKRIERLLTKRHIVLLTGPTGIGKTFLARNFFLSKGYDIKFINGSRRITPDKIPKTKTSLDGRTIAFLIDEFDRGLSENYENIQKHLFKIILEGKMPVDAYTHVPTIATCNEPKKIQLSDFYIDTINLKPLPVESIQEIVAKATKKEIDDPDVLDRSEKCKGNVRAAINNIEMKNYEAKDEISQSTFIRNFLRKEPDQAFEYAKKYKVGEYKGIMGVEWLIAIVSRNLDDNVRAKMAVLAEASRNKYKINVEMTLHAISSVCPIFVQKVNFPGKT
jgi:replication-associated recombination protein RarA